MIPGLGFESGHYRSLESYELLWGERVVRSLANLARYNAEEFLTGLTVGRHGKSASAVFRYGAAGSNNCPGGLKNERRPRLSPHRGRAISATAACPLAHGRTIRSAAFPTATP